VPFKWFDCCVCFEHKCRTEKVANSIELALGAAIFMVCRANTWVTKGVYFTTMKLFYKRGYQLYFTRFNDCRVLHLYPFELLSVYQVYVDLGLYSYSLGCCTKFYSTKGISVTVSFQIKKSVRLKFVQRSFNWETISSLCKQDWAGSVDHRIKDFTGNAP